ncbi:MAG: hypothetical protein ACI9LM_005050 [Alteromonadaceae bacterium]
MNIRGDSTTGNISADVDVDPSFIMDHLDMGVMLHFESIKDDTFSTSSLFCYEKHLSGLQVYALLEIKDKAETTVFFQN